MTETTRGSSNLSDRDRETIHSEVLKRCPEAGKVGAAEIDALLDRISDNFHSLFARLQSTMDVTDGGVAGMFFSESTETDMVGEFAVAVIRNGWDGKRLPDTFDGRAAYTGRYFHPTEVDEADVEAVVSEFVREFAAASGIDEDAFEDAIEPRLYSSMLEYVATEAAHAEAPGPFPCMRPAGAHDGTLFFNEFTGLHLEVVGDPSGKSYGTYSLYLQDVIDQYFLHEADQETAAAFFAEFWLRTAVRRIGLGFHLDTTPDQYEPRLSSVIEQDYDRMIEFAHEHLEDPYEAPLQEMTVIVDELDRGTYKP